MLPTSQPDRNTGSRDLGFRYLTSFTPFVNSSPRNLLPSTSSFQTPFYHYPHHISLLCPPCLPSHPPLNLWYALPWLTFLTHGSPLIPLVPKHASITQNCLTDSLIESHFAIMVVSILALLPVKIYLLGLSYLWPMPPCGIKELNAPSHTL